MGVAAVGGMGGREVEKYVTDRGKGGGCTVNSSVTTHQVTVVMAGQSYRHCPPVTLVPPL